MRPSIRGYWRMSQEMSKQVALEDVSCPLGCIESDLFLSAVTIGYTIAKVNFRSFSAVPAA